MSPTTPDLPLDLPAADDAHYCEILKTLIETGVKLVNALPEAPDLAADQRIDAYDRGARAIRRAIILVRHITEHPLHHGTATPAPDHAVAVRRAVARKQIIRAIDDHVAQHVEDGGQVEALRLELCERLDAPDLDDDIINRPIRDVIAEIRRDLGLANTPGVRPRPRRTPECLRSFAMLAAAPAGAAVPLALQHHPPHDPDHIAIDDRAATHPRDG